MKVEERLPSHIEDARSLLDDAIQAGSECLEVKLFTWEEIPWSELAFPSIGWALQHDREARSTRDFTARINPPGF